MLLMEPRPVSSIEAVITGHVFLLHFNRGSLCSITKHIFLKLKICRYFLPIIPTQIWELPWCFWQPLRPAPYLLPLVAQLVNNSSAMPGDPGSIPGSGRSAGEGTGYLLQYSWASLVAQLVNNPPASDSCESELCSAVLKWEAHAHW